MARQDNFITDNMERIELFRSLQLRLATSAHCLLGFGWTGRELWRHLTAAAQAQLACWNTQTAWQYPGETCAFLGVARFRDMTELIVALVSQELINTLILH